GQGRPSKTPQFCGVSAEKAATLLNVSERSVETAKAVKREAIPEVVEEVKAGKMSVAAERRQAGTCRPGNGRWHWR
ncbi:MAG: hypothetical protein ACXW3X_10150, partial [Rhodoplanes sp.]